MVASMHVGSSSQVPSIAPDSPFMANLAWGAIRTSGAMLSWIFSGMFQRYPNLKIALSEGEIGWIPYFLERAEQVLDKQRHWVKRGQKFMDHAATDVDLDQLDIRADVPRPHLRLLHRGPPRHRQPRRDRRGQRHVRDRLPALRLDVARLHRRRPTAGRRTCPPRSQYKLLRGNAERLYRFTPAEPPVPRRPDVSARLTIASTATCASAAGCASSTPPAPSPRTPRPRPSCSTRRPTSSTRSAPRSRRARRGARITIDERGDERP